MTLADTVRRHDPDRYFTALFAPTARREALFTLYAFNHELAHAREAALREPGLALIRLQWWREVVEGAARRHEVATPLRAELAAGRLDPEECLRMIEGRDMEAEDGMADLAAFERYCLAAHGSVMAAAGKALGVADVSGLRRVGAGCGAVWVMRKRPEWLPEGDVVGAARGWLAVPKELRRNAAALPAVLAARDLGRGVRPRLVWDQLAVVGRAWFGV